MAFTVYSNSVPAIWIYFFQWSLKDGLFYTLEYTLLALIGHLSGICINWLINSHKK